MLTDGESRDDCETSKWTEAGYVCVPTVHNCFGFDDGTDNVIGVGLDDMRLYMVLGVVEVVDIDERFCCRSSLLNISFSESGANDQNDPLPSLAGRGTLTKACKGNIID